MWLDQVLPEYLVLEDVLIARGVCQHWKQQLGSGVVRAVQLPYDTWHAVRQPSPWQLQHLLNCWHGYHAVHFVHRAAGTRLAINNAFEIIAGVRSVTDIQVMGRVGDDEWSRIHQGLLKMTARLTSLGISFKPAISASALTQFTALRRLHLYTVLLSSSRVTPVASMVHLEDLELRFYSMEAQYDGAVPLDKLSALTRLTQLALNSENGESLALHTQCYDGMAVNVPARS